MGQVPEVSGLTNDDIAALSGGRCDRPFDILGPHDGWLTVYYPDIAALDAVTDAGSLPLERVFGDLFRGRVSGSYRLKARSADGTEWLFDDPYRFGPVLGDIDLHLLGEGTHRRLWKALGAHVMVHEAVAGDLMPRLGDLAHKMRMVSGNASQNEEGRLNICVGKERQRPCGTGLNARWHLIPDVSRRCRAQGRGMEIVLHIDAHRVRKKEFLIAP